MRKLIIVEGPTDIKFITDFINYRYKIKLNEDDIIKSGGYTNLPSIKQQFKKNIGGKNLVIFDADEDHSHRVNYLENQKAKLNIDFDLFLFPNDQSSGDLETLLKQIAEEHKKPFFDCWTDYINCLKKHEEEFKSLNGGYLDIPDNHVMIYAYLALFEKERKKKLSENWDFFQTKYWNLDSEALLPLTTFLDQYFLEP